MHLRGYRELNLSVSQSAFRRSNTIAGYEEKRIYFANVDPRNVASLFYEQILSDYVCSSFFFSLSILFR